jgi:hypothetical protein
MTLLQPQRFDDEPAPYTAIRSFDPASLLQA